jgi:hypothetical protein
MDSRIPTIVAQLRLPHDIRDLLVRRAFECGLDVETVVEAFRAIYCLGFYDGCIEGKAEACLVKLEGRNYERR